VVESGSNNPLAFMLVVFVPEYLAIGCRGGSCPVLPANGVASRSTGKKSNYIMNFKCLPISYKNAYMAAFKQTVGLDHRIKTYQ
jgi:hypothetical protein